MPRVLNISTLRTQGLLSSTSGVYIGRRSPYGNPFVIGRDGNRTQVLMKYSKWLESQPNLIKKARRELAGKDLLCHCSPLPCHGDILLRLVNPEVARKLSVVSQEIPSPSLQEFLRAF